MKRVLLVRCWEDGKFSSLLQFQSGTPCSVAGSSDYTADKALGTVGVGLDSNFGCGVNGQYWVMNGKPKILGNFGSGKWFDTSVFSQPTAGTFNTQRVRDVIYQPGFNNWNLGLFKSFPIRESMGFQFRAEAFNFLNHPNWGGASGGGVTLTPPVRLLVRSQPRAANATYNFRCASISRQQPIRSPRISGPRCAG